MGVDLATYRARIGTFISRRNVSCGDEKHSPVNVTRRWRGKDICKVSDRGCYLENLKYVIARISLWFDKTVLILDVLICASVEFVRKWQSRSKKQTYEPHQGDARMSTAAGKILLALVVTSSMSIRQLLILAGDVELNPGPLGQHGEGGDGPVLKDLVCLKVPPTKWYQLGLQLNISERELDVIKVNNPVNVNGCILEMFKTWLNNTSNASYADLGEALNRIGEHSVAAQVTSSAGLAAQTTSTSTGIPVKGENATTRNLKGRYCSYKPAQVDFPPVPTFSFINLALVKDTTEVGKSDFYFNTIQGSLDDVVETKVTITYDGLLESVNSENRIILLEGRPGCGKTTLMRKLSKDWGEGSVLTFVKYLFLIPLRQFYTKPITSIHTILEYFGVKKQKLETEIEENVGHGVCFVFDGLDEYSQKYTKDGHSWFQQLLRGEVLSSSIVIITSRPNASLELRESVHSRGEVLGFLKEQIDQYIDRSYPTNPPKAAEVKAYLHDHQNIRHMCYIPLHLVMIIFIYNNRQENAMALPKTEADVYHIFTRMSLVRYFRKKGREIQIKDLELLPSPELVLARGIFKLAYIATSASKTSILSEDVMSLGGEWSADDIANLGILVMDKTENESGAESIFSFVHLTNQEFLAAYHVSRLPPGEQLKAIREHVVQPHMGVVLKFFCGLTKLQNDDHWSVIMNSALIEDRGDKKVNLRALHCVFESQNDQRCRELFTKAGGKLVIKNETLTLLDYCAVGYCIEAANNLVKEIELRCQLTAEGLDIITEKLTHTMDSVRSIKIEDDLHDKDKLVALKRLICKHPQVESLNLSGCFNKRGCSDWSLVVDILKATLHLHTLDLGFNRIGADGMKELCAAASHLNNLQSLNLGGNGIGADGMKELCAVASHLNNLQSLDLTGNYIGDDGMKELCAAASHLNNLQSLNLGYNSIGAVGMKELCAAASHLNNLQSLDLQNTNLGDANIDSLLHIINHCPLKELRLDYTLFSKLCNTFSSRPPNRFSTDGAELLREKAKSIRPDMKLDLPRPTTTANPPRPTTTANPPRATTIANPPRATRTLL